jgi:hypothetical protein
MRNNTTATIFWGRKYWERCNHYSVVGEQETGMMYLFKFFEGTSNENDVTIIWALMGTMLQLLTQTK